jgi:hypothetical protein
MTAAQQGIVLFDFIDNPSEVEEIINRLRQHVQAMDVGQIQSTMRASLEEHFKTEPSYEKVALEEGEEEIDERPEILDRSLGLLSRIRRGVSSRVEDGNVITYRKHIFTLFRRTWWLIAASIAFFALAIVVTSITAALILLILWGISLAWLIWRFEDWRNDTFQVTDRFVIDIDRRPFGFGESRKQAELGNVQNINADRPGLLPTIFNYGFVYIETAGASADITFEKVVNPNRIQSEIFKRREEFRQKQRKSESQQRRKEYAILLDVYQQAQEQDRLPRRTPTGDTPPEEEAQE